MKFADVTFRGVSPYSQSRYHGIERKAKQTAKDHEAEHWRDRCHYDADGFVYIPPMAFKNCVSEIAKFLGVQIPGKGKSTYTKHFEAGVIVTDGVSLPVRREDVKGEWLFVPADGKRGGGKRVEKCFPVIHEWGGMVTFIIFDDTITEEVFTNHIKQAGQFIGIGRFRPRNNGYYGRFKVEAINWREPDEG